MPQKSLGQKGVAHILFLIILVIGIGVGVYLSLNPQVFRSKASSGVACLAPSQLPLKVPVLVLQYLPTDPANPNLLDGQETGYAGDATIGGRTISYWEEKTDEMVSALKVVLNEATKFHGYKDPTAPEFLNFEIADTKKFFTPIQKGYPLGTNRFGTTAYRPHYANILKGVNICDYVDNKNVKEVWMYGYHNDRTIGTIVPDESRMSSKYGDISNSGPKEESLPAEFRMPICKNAYTLYNFGFAPGGKVDIGGTVHNRIHQFENIIPFLEGSQYYPPSHQNTVNSIFWGSFSEYIQFNPETKHVNADGTRKNGYLSVCGNAHAAPNWTNAKQQEYRYDLQNTAQFSCEDWNPDTAATPKLQSFSCSRWGCTEIGFYKYWMQNMPGYNNSMTYNGKPMRNWWEAIYDFNAAVEKGRTLTTSSIFCSGTPTASTPQAIVEKGAGISLSAPAEAVYNTTFPVKVFVKSDDDAINLVSAKIKFDPNALQVYSISELPSFVTSWVEKYHNSSTGEISFTGGLPSPGIKSDATTPQLPFITINFKSKTTGITDIQVLSTSEIYRNSDNTNIIQHTLGTPVAITPPIPAPPSQPTASGAPSASPTPSYGTPSYSTPSYSYPTPSLPSPTPAPTPFKSPTPTTAPTSQPASTPASSPVASGKKGDGNKDGKLNLADLSMLFSNFNKESNFPIELDINSDGKINSVDFASIRVLLVQAGVIR